MSASSEFPFWEKQEQRLQLLCQLDRAPAAFVPEFEGRAALP